MKKMTIEQAEKILKDGDESVPEKFSVKRIAYSKTENAFFVEWTNDSLKDAYKAAVADTVNPDSAKNAYTTETKSQFSVIFANDDTEGKGVSYVVQSLSDEEKQQYATTLKDLVAIDAV